MDAQEQLTSRPSFEAAERDYLDTLDEVRATVGAAVPDLQWRAEAASRSDRGVCAAPFDRVDGAKTGIYSSGDAVGAIPDQRWPEVLASVTALLRDRGFGEVTVLQDEPGAHEVSVGDPATGARVVLGTNVNTILTLYGGCFLVEDGG